MFIYHDHTVFVNVFLTFAKLLPQKYSDAKCGDMLQPMASITPHVTVKTSVSC